MKLLSRPRSGRGRGEVSGPVRADRRLASVLRTARPGDIVVLDHVDLDRAQAQALLDHGVVAVVNASAFISGRYPNLGPEMLASAGVALIDSVGPEVFARARNGAHGRLSGGDLLVGDDVLARGSRLDLDEIRRQMDAAREGLSTQLQSLTHNTTEFLRREQALLLHGQGVPELRTPMRGRPVVVVVRDFDHEADLRRMRRFVKEQHPVLVGVDGGADALLAVRLKPDLVIVGEAGLAPGTHTGVSDRALTGAGEVLVHVDESDRVPGIERLDRLGLRPSRIVASGITEDIALLVADTRGASLIVTVGTHATLDEFLDRQRSGLSSTFLTRLKVGPRLVDAKSVPQLYAGGVRAWQVILVLLVGLLAVLVAVATTPAGAAWWDDLRVAVEDLSDQIRGTLS